MFCVFGNFFIRKESKNKQTNKKNKIKLETGSGVEKIWCFIFKSHCLDLSLGCEYFCKMIKEVTRQTGAETYFDRTVEALMEALSCVEAEHLNLEQRWASRNTNAEVNYWTLLP